MPSIHDNAPTLSICHQDTAIPFRKWTLYIDKLHHFVMFSLLKKSVASGCELNMTRKHGKSSHLVHRGFGCHWSFAGGFGGPLLTYLQSANGSTSLFVEHIFLFQGIELDGETSHCRLSNFRGPDSIDVQIDISLATLPAIIEAKVHEIL